MQFGVNTFLFSSPYSTRETSLFEKVARMGFQVFEMAIEDPELIETSNARVQLENYRLKPVVCTVVGPERNFAADSETVYQTASQYLSFCIDCAAQIGAKIVCGPFHSAVGYTELLSESERSRVLERVAFRLRPLAAKAADSGILLAFETLNRFENCLINTTAQALELIRMVDNPALGIHLDTFHMNIEEKDIPEAIRLAGPSLYHFHTCENDRGILGTGHIPWKDVAIALGEVNYQGDLVIESFTDQVRSISRAVSTWRKLAPSSEVLAEKGLQFLKSNFLSLS